MHEHTQKQFNAQEGQNCPANRFVETDVSLPFAAIASRIEVDYCRSRNLGFQERLHAKILPITIYRIESNQSCTACPRVETYFALLIES